METTIILGFIGILEKKIETTVILGVYWDNGKESGSYYIHLG